MSSLLNLFYEPKRVGPNVRYPARNTIVVEEGMDPQAAIDAAQARYAATSVVQVVTAMPGAEMYTGELPEGVIYKTFEEIVQQFGEGVFTVGPGQRYTTIDAAISAAAAAQGYAGLGREMAFAVFTINVDNPVDGTVLHYYSFDSNGDKLHFWISRIDPQDARYVWIDTSGCASAAQIAVAIADAMTAATTDYPVFTPSGNTVICESGSYPPYICLAQAHAGDYTWDEQSSTLTAWVPDVGGVTPVASTVVVLRGTYAENISLIDLMSVFGVGNPVIDGNLAIPPTAAIRGINVTGSITGEGTDYADANISLQTRAIGCQAAQGNAEVTDPTTFAAGAGPITGLSNRQLVAGQQSLSNDTSIVDAQIPGPFFTNARSLVCIVADDTGTSWETVLDALGPATPLAYAIAHNVPFSWGIIPSKMDKSPLQMIDTANLEAAIKAVGGELCWHDHFPLNDTPWGRAEEIFDADDKIEGIGFDVRTGLHTGNFDPGISLNMPYGITNRMRHAAFRNGEASCFPTFPVPRYPLNCLKVANLTDASGAAHWCRRIIESMAASEGLTFCIYIHNVVNSATPGENDISVTQFIALIGALEAAQLAGTIAIVPAWQMAATYPIPAYDPERGMLAPNLIINPGFEYKDDEGGDDGFSFSAITTALRLKIIDVKKEPGSTIGISTVEHKYGAASCELVRTTSVCVLAYRYLPVLFGGRQLRLRFWHKTKDIGTPADSTVTFTPDVGAEWSYTIPKSVGVWAQKHINVTIPKTTPNHITWVHVAFSPGMETTLYLDDIYLGH